MGEIRWCRCEMLRDDLGGDGEVMMVTIDVESKRRRVLLNGRIQKRTNNATFVLVGTAGLE